jgi:hypothetical protein
MIYTFMGITNWETVNVYVREELVLPSVPGTPFSPAITGFELESIRSGTSRCFSGIIRQYKPDPARRSSDLYL